MSEERRARCTDEACEKTGPECGRAALCRACGRLDHDRRDRDWTLPFCGVAQTFRRHAAGGVLAKSLETLIYPEHVSILEGTSADVERRRYELVKSSLVRLATAKNDIEYAYLVTARDGKVIYLADSLSASDPASALPGDPYPEATEAFRTALEEGKNAFIPEMRDARGRGHARSYPSMTS